VIQLQSDNGCSSSTEGSEPDLLTISESSRVVSAMLEQVAEAMTPPILRSPAEWADANREEPPGSPEPGKWRSSRTPYCTPIGVAAISPLWREIAAVMGTQMGKSAGLLNIIGRKLDDDPAPILYLGPTKSNIDKVFEPQVQRLLRSAKSLWGKTVKGRKAQKLAKVVSGVMLRMGWAGSAAEVAAFTAHTALVDELDRTEAIPGEGDLLTLARARISNYVDGLLIATSTPTEGSVDVEKHPDTGIEHWALADPEDVASPIWKLFQEGTRFEWAVPCPHCHRFFVPRFRLLSWPEGCTPARALREAAVACQRCGQLIEDSHKNWMNGAGVYLAPGQDVEDWDPRVADPLRPDQRNPGPPEHPCFRGLGSNGRVVGEVPESDTATFWVSGLMSPWRTFGQRAAAWLRAVRSGDQDRVRAVLNTEFGEMYRLRGQAPEWSALKEDCGQSYTLEQVPRGAQLLFLTVDVQQDRLVCTVRAWGAEFESWLVWREELWGDTAEPPVWMRLDALAARQFGGMPISVYAVDSGYRTEQVYEWCRRHSNAYATKGAGGRITKLFHATDAEVNHRGKRLKTGIKVWAADDGYFKAWVHDHIAWPQDQPGSWHLPSDIDEDYCKQVVAEQRMRLPSGRVQWMRVHKDNHYLDCEWQQAFLAHVAGVRHLKPLATDDAGQPAPARPQQRRIVRSKYLGRR
jgi:phage terminase large subunit GpA-like protein